MIKFAKRLGAAALAALFSFAAACTPAKTTAETSGEERPDKKLTYTQSAAPLYNPLMGFAAEADYKKAVGENTLVYIEVLWRDVEPEEGVYDFAGLEEKNNLAEWRGLGKHAVLRFMCDKPSKEAHRDIPDWLYEKTKDGTDYAYDGSHKGYSPDYSNQTFIDAHKKVIEALGGHFGRDTFVSFVELGSLGHWGEWHVNYESGIVRMPKEAVREQYVTPYLDAFPKAKLLMRRPFNTAAAHGFGLYDDTAGNPAATADWLDWIQNGGDYAQAEEDDALSPMPEAWKTAPMGGEFNSDLAMKEMLTGGLNTTLCLLKQSHTTFLGPNFPTATSADNGQGCEAGIEAVRYTLGYRLWIEQAAYLEPAEGQAGSLALTWTNSGVAPMYWDWPVYLYFFDADKNLLGRLPVEVQTTKILPDEKVVSTTVLPDNNLTAQNAYICLGIEDPMTGKPAVTLAMDAESIDGTTVLLKK